MRRLNAESCDKIAHVLEKCNLKHGYIVRAFIPDTESIHNVVDEIIRVMCERNCGSFKETIVNLDEATIYFKNNSCFRIMKVPRDISDEEYANFPRTLKCNSLVIQRGVNKKVAENILRAMIVPYYDNMDNAEIQVKPIRIKFEE